GPFSVINSTEGLSFIVAGADIGPCSRIERAGAGIHDTIGTIPRSVFLIHATTQSPHPRHKSVDTDTGNHFAPRRTHIRGDGYSCAPGFGLLLNHTTGSKQSAAEIHRAIACESCPRRVATP